MNMIREAEVRAFLSYLLLIFAITIQSCGQNSKKEVSHVVNDTVVGVANREETAVQTLKDFYTAYISERSKPDENWESTVSMKKKYLTKKLQEKLEDEDLDYDPIIDAQDCDENWTKTLEINAEASHENVYNVCFVSFGDNQKKRIKLLLIKDNGNYLIDDILSDVNIHCNE
jgi:hypothetical protein